MVLPLITLPYLVRVLGVENFGLVNFSLAIIMYFNILVSFGFNLSATRDISINRDNLEKISEIFSAVMIVKIIIACISLLILSVLILFVNMFSEHAMLYYATFGIVIGNVVFPSWFFQGMERMKYITYINVISKISFTILIFVLVKNNTDYIFVPILNSLGAVLGGLYSLWLIFKLFNVKVRVPSRKIIQEQVKNSYHFFLSRVASNGSRYFATTMIGIYFGNTLVGYYSMVEKLFYAFMSLGGIVSQTIYPYMSRTKNIIFFKKLFLIVISTSILILIPVMYFNEELLFVVFHVKSDMLSTIFIIVFSGSIFGIASALVGYPLLAAFGYIKEANNSLIYASLLYVLYILFTTLILQNIFYVSAALVIYEFLAITFRLFYLKKVKILTLFKG
jgi:PST family polysaccharide transporter